MAAAALIASPVMEEWKPVSYDDRYEVSNFGRVRSYCRFGGPNLLKPGLGSHGYPTVTIGRKHGSKLVHVLVAEAFLGPRPFEGAEVLHSDGNRANPRLDNLTWGTRSQNIRDNKWNGGERKLTGAEAALIKQELRRGTKGVRLSERFDVSQSLISAIKHGAIHADA